MGYKVGLDVFAPFMSYFVGQDIPALSRLCDFVKPMMYGATFAPAGLPFELEALNAATAATNGGHEFCKTLRLDPDMRPFDFEFIQREVKHLANACSCPVYAGVEINRIPGIADTDPAYVKNALSACSDASGYVLSWNMLDAPMEHINAVKNLLN